MINLTMTQRGSLASPHNDGNVAKIVVAIFQIAFHLSLQVNATSEVIQDKK